MAIAELGRVMQRLMSKLRRHSQKPILRKALQDTITDINRKGPRRQLQYLIETLGIDEAEVTLDALVGDEEIMHEIVRRVENNNLRDKLVCLVYETSVKMAHDTVMSGALAQVRFLVESEGVINLETRIDEMVNLEQTKLL
jgi:ribosomal protein S7